jgi:CheY-like chemotaxis protein
VEDTGIGISPEFLSQIFVPFAQEHRAEAGNVSGTGLGLAIVKRIVDLMGGVIRVESKLNRGTRFTVDLPVSVVKNGQVQETEKQEPVLSLAGKKVLLCEDNDLNAEIVAILMREDGVDMERAENGSEGLRKFAASPLGCYDAVLMDIRMPVLDGYGATEKIRALPRADAKTVPIIAMTADAFEEDIRHALESGMDGYLTKPIDPGHLRRTLANAIQTGRNS